MLNICSYRRWEIFPILQYLIMIIFNHNARSLYSEPITRNNVSLLFPFYTVGILFAPAALSTKSLTCGLDDLPYITIHFVCSHVRRHHLFFLFYMVLIPKKYHLHRCTKGCNITIQSTSFANCACMEDARTITTSSFGEADTNN